MMFIDIDSDESRFLDFLTFYHRIDLGRSDEKLVAMERPGHFEHTDHRGCIEALSYFDEPRDIETGRFRSRTRTWQTWCEKAHSRTVAA